MCALQSHFTALAYNLLLLTLNDLESQHQLRDTKVEEKRKRWMGRRQAAAEHMARTVNRLVQSVRRISEHSLQILRWLRHHLRARSTLEASLSDAPRLLLRLHLREGWNGAIQHFAFTRLWQKRLCSYA